MRSSAAAERVDGAGGAEGSVATATQGYAAGLKCS